jgi:hypothetical protein
MTALATARAVLLATSSKAWPSLHPETFLRNSNFFPGLERHKVFLEF